jgi:hypothetical protein
MSHPPESWTPFKSLQETIGLEAERQQPTGATVTDAPFLVIAARTDRNGV